MNIEQVEVVVVGGGQAGMAMSEHLEQRRRAARGPRTGTHRGEMALRALGLARGERARLARPVPRPRVRRRPGRLRAEGAGRRLLRGLREEDRRRRSAAASRSPRCRRTTARPASRWRPPTALLDARFVVAATGPFQRPVIPPIVPRRRRRRRSCTPPPTATRGSCPRGASSWSAPGPRACRSPPSSSSAGRRVYLSVGPHDRPPRRYRGRDNVWWLGVLGKWETSTPSAGRRARDHRGERRATAATRSTSATSPPRASPWPAGPRRSRDGTVRFAADLRDNIAAGDANYLSVLDEADAYVARNGLDLPEEPEARVSRSRPGLRDEPAARTRPRRAPASPRSSGRPATPPTSGG